MKHRYQHKYVFPVIIGLIVACISLLGFAFYRIQQQTTYPSDKSLSTIGIKIDQSQGYLDFEKLSSTDLSFVYLKSTQGKSYFDDDFASNRERLAGSRLDFGVIHVFSDESAPVDQFKYFVNKVGNNVGNLPIMLELVEEKPSHEYVENLFKFLDLMNQQYFMPVFVQTTEEQLAEINKVGHVNTAFDNDKIKDSKSQLLVYNHDGKVGGAVKMTDLTMYAFIGSKEQYKTFKDNLEGNNAKFRNYRN